MPPSSHLERRARCEQPHQLRIRGELAIDGIQVGSLGDRLGHDDSIERVLMVHRKIGDDGEERRRRTPRLPRRRAWAIRSVRRSTASLDCLPAFRVRRAPSNEMHELRINPEPQVRGIKRQRLGHCLCDQKTIEWITVMHREARHCRRRLPAYRQFAESALKRHRSDLFGTEIEVSEAFALLDGNLPDTGRAEIDLIARILQNNANVGREPTGLAYCPKKDVRIKQQAHQRPSNSAMISSGSGSSKSSGM